MKKSLTLNAWACIAIIMLCIGGCKNDETENTTPPTLTGVTNLVNRNTPLTAVGYGEWIAIQGTNLSTAYKVDFNGTLAKDSLLYGNDNTVTVKIPSQLTDPINNPITVTTKYGSATLNFQIKQPPPLITSFNPPAGAPNDEVTIVGNYFKGVTSVTIGGVAATIVSNTQTEIKVKVPATISYGSVSVTTPVGTVTADKTFGLKHVIFDDALRGNWTNTSYSATWDMLHTTIVRRGTYSIAHKFTVGFGACRFRSLPTFSTTGYTTLKISIYGGPGTAGKKVRISLTPAKLTYDLILSEGSWTDYQIPLVNIGSPTTIDYITFQEFSGLASQIYIDDVGFY
ncbi:MAG: IPT/TIG domain-containing protein [Pedobacter sp.]